MRPRIIVILLFSHAALLIGGFYVGKMMSFPDALKQANSISSMAATGMLSEYVKSRLETGGCSEARQALLTFDRALDELRKRDGDKVSDLYFFDRVLTYTRLAKIARKQGDQAAAAEYLSIAQKTCNGGKWSDCSERALNDITEQLDRKIPIKCLKGTG
jgi:arginine utilization protein RocB